MCIDDAMLSEYLRRSYHAVDGLWFVMVEEAHDFEQALDLDRRVWESLAKIQARKARELMGADDHSTENLARCFALKLTADGHRFTVNTEEEGVYFTIQDCPWLQLLRKSNREHLAAMVAQTICPTEGRVWSAEFGGAYDFEMPAMACKGDTQCRMRFLRKSR